HAKIALHRHLPPVRGAGRTDPPSPPAGPSGLTCWRQRPRGYHLSDQRNRARYRRSISPLSPALSEALSVEPEVFEALPVVDAVDHQGQPLHRRCPTDRAAREEDDRPGVVLNQLPLDLPNQLLALSQIGFDRLLID